MIIDCHAHVSPPSALWVHKASLLSHMGAHGSRMPEVTDAEILAAANRKEMAPKGHLDMMDQFGIDLQMLSPRPFQMMHSAKPSRLVHWFTEETNNIIARTVQLMPKRFVAVAGLPQAAGEPVAGVLPELERCVKMGFRGVLLNPDPYENSGTEPPSLADRYWYPLYEKLCELDVPMHTHSTTSHSERAPYTLNFINEETIAIYNLVQGHVFKDFPGLKVICSHGGGAMPYQIGRFESASSRRGGSFLEGMRNIYYDTVLYSEDALRLLIKTVGADRCVFGSECPGVGSTIDPATGRQRDDIRPVIESFEWLSAADKQLIFEGNARKLFGLPA